VVLDLLRAQREGEAALARRRTARLDALVAHARSQTAFYRGHYAALPPGRVRLEQLPPVTKTELMAHFDEWVSDPAVTRAAVAEFVAQPSRVGQPLLGRYFVCATSGTTGEPGLFVHEPAAMEVYRSFSVRADLMWLSVGDWLALARRGFRWAAVVGTGGHFGGEAWMEYERRRSVWRRRTYRVFSVQDPLPALVRELDDFDPAIVTCYPSAAALLAEQQAAGRLHLRPAVFETGGESTTPATRGLLEATWGRAVRDVYAASEFNPLAFGCDEGWLHVNSDWAVLEPVEADHTPTPKGSRSSTVLLTNLANRVQPTIRYDLGDSVVERPDPCPCGSPLQAIRVTGRRDDVLVLQAAGGERVVLAPLAVSSVLEITPGVHRSQLIRTGPDALRLRLELRPGADPDSTWHQATGRLRDYLARQGLPGVQVERGTEPPQKSARSGKFHQVVGVPATSPDDG
jgi:phenylacetate-coenzyme A ligase PaaK-like adenylate-forming protein